MNKLASESGRGALTITWTETTLAETLTLSQIAGKFRDKTALAKL